MKRIFILLVSFLFLIVCFLPCAWATTTPSPGTIGVVYLQIQSADWQYNTVDGQSYVAVSTRGYDSLRFPLHTTAVAGSSPYYYKLVLMSIAPFADDSIISPDSRLLSIRTSGYVNLADRGFGRLKLPSFPDFSQGSAARLVARC